MRQLTWWDRERPWAVLVPPLTAGLLMLAFFAVTDRWHDLENPVQSQVAIVCAIIGVAAGIAMGRIRHWEWVAIPGAVTLAVALWAYFAPHSTPEDNDFRQILVVLTFVLAIATAAINIPQIVRGRFQ